MACGKVKIFLFLKACGEYNDMFKLLISTSAVVKDVIMVYYVNLNTEKNDNEYNKTYLKINIMLGSLLLEDIGQTAIQFTYYEQFINWLDGFTFSNASIMVKRRVSKLIFYHRNYNLGLSRLLDFL